MTSIVMFSGGKDSTALVLWALRNLPSFTAVWCDTGWEHPLTLQYIWRFTETVLNGSLTVVRSARYAGFEDLVLQKGQFPGIRSRFCTDELKIKPLHAFLESIDDEIVVYQGVRAEESAARAAMPARQWVNEGGGYWMERPLLDWSSDDVFRAHREAGVEPNPLYSVGAGRVGCWPCIMSNQRELRALAKQDHGMVDRVVALEQAVNADKPSDRRASFFRHNTIPERFRSGVWRKDDGDTVRIGTADDVFSYLLERDADQLPLLPTPRCVSVYNLCE